MSEGSPDGDARRRRIWTLEGDHLRAIDVVVGPSDGALTEVSGADLVEGMPVVVAELHAESAAPEPATTNPFTPQMGRGSSRPR